MRVSDVTPELRRLIQVLMRWTGASVTAVARDAKVSQGNLSRLLGASQTPGMGAAKAASVLRELQWDANGPLPKTVQRWVIDSEKDFRWMFNDVLKGAASISAVVHDEATLEYLNDVGIFLGRVGNSLMVIQSDSADFDLGQTLRTNQVYVKSEPPVVIENHTQFLRVTAGQFQVGELEELVLKPKDRFEIPDWLHHAAIRLWELLGTEDNIEGLLNDVHTMLARSDPEKYFQVKLQLLLDFLEAHNTFVKSRDPEDLKRHAREDVERQAKQNFFYSWRGSLPAAKKDAGN